MDQTNVTRVNPQIFREYDIRGIVDRDLTGPSALRWRTR